MISQELKEGDRIRDKYRPEDAGVVLSVWDGKYSSEECYNPYRIIVRFDNSTAGLLSNGTLTVRAEDLEKVEIKDV